MAGIRYPRIYQIPVVQVLILVSVSLALTAVNRGWALSALCGGLLAVIPALYFSAYAFRYRGARQARQIVRAFNRGESGKFVLTLLGFALVFVLVKPLYPLWVFSVYLLMLVVQWIVTARVLTASHK